MHCLSSSGPDYKTDIQTPGRQHTVADFSFLSRAMKYFSCETLENIWCWSGGWRLGCHPGLGVGGDSRGEAGNRVEP